VSDQSTDGLRKAARRVFWEASQIEKRKAAAEQAIAQAQERAPTTIVPAEPGWIAIIHSPRRKHIEHAPIVAWRVTGDCAEPVTPDYSIDNPGRSDDHKYIRGPDMIIRTVAGDIWNSEGEWLRSCLDDEVEEHGLESVNERTYRNLPAPACQIIPSPPGFELLALDRYGWHGGAARDITRDPILAWRIPLVQDDPVDDPWFMEAVPVTLQDWYVWTMHSSVGIKIPNGSVCYRPRCRGPATFFRSEDEWIAAVQAEMAEAMEKLRADAATGVPEAAA
jgi:hypothetical protein